MEEGGEVENIGFGKRVHQGRGERQLVQVLLHRQPPHIAQDGEDVVVDGVDVEEVVLQQADDVFPRGQVAAEHAVEVEKTHGVGEAAAVAEKADKAAAVGFVGVKRGIDMARGRPPGAQGFRRQFAQIAARLQNLHSAENVFGLPAEQVFVAHGQLVADLVIVGVDVAHDTRQRRIHAAAQHRQDNAVELLYCLGGAVKAAHQPLVFFQTASAGRIGHTVRQTVLQIENQPVFLAPGRQVQIDADGSQIAVAAYQKRGFGAREDAAAEQGGDAGVQPLRFGQPQHGMDVAQPAGTGFHIRFE